MAFGDHATLRDDFNRPDEAPVSTGWSNKVVASNGNMNLASNELAGAGSGVNSAWYTGATPAADFEAYCTLTVGPASGNVFRIYGRLATPGAAGVDGYFVQVTKVLGSNNDTTTLFRLDNASAITLASTSTVDWLAGHKIGLEIIGSELKVYQDTGSGWIQVLSVTDATYSAAGPCGLGNSATVCRLDDFFMGDVVTPSWVPRAVLL